MGLDFCKWYIFPFKDCERKNGQGWGVLFCRFVPKSKNYLQSDIIRLNFFFKWGGQWSIELRFLLPPSLYYGARFSHRTMEVSSWPAGQTLILWKSGEPSMFSASPTTKYDSPEEIAVLAKQITMSWNEKKSFDVNFWKALQNVGDKENRVFPPFWWSSLKQQFSFDYLDTAVEPKMLFSCWNQLCGLAFRIRNDRH